MVKAMKEFAAGSLHSGKGGPVVKSRSQAIAIGMSEQRKGRNRKKRRPRKSPYMKAMEGK
mgnify:CR=1 FL=1